MMVIPFINNLFWLPIVINPPRVNYTVYFLSGIPGSRPGSRDPGRWVNYNRQAEYIVDKWKHYRICKFCGIATYYGCKVNVSLCLANILLILGKCRIRCIIPPSFSQRHPHSSQFVDLTMKNSYTKYFMILSTFTMGTFQIKIPLRAVRRIGWAAILAFGWLLRLWL